MKEMEGLWEVSKVLEKIDTEEVILGSQNVLLSIQASMKWLNLLHKGCQIIITVAENAQVVP